MHTQNSALAHDSICKLQLVALHGLSIQWATGRPWRRFLFEDLPLQSVASNESCITFHISNAVSGGPAQVVIRVIVLIIVLIILRLLRMRLDGCSVCCLSPVQEPRHTLQIENPSGIMPVDFVA